MCVVLVVVAVRFVLWTMMPQSCFSRDDFIVLRSSNFSDSSSVIASYIFFLATSAKQQRKPQAKTTFAGTVAAGQRRLRVPSIPAGAAPSRWGLFCLAYIVLAFIAVRFGLWTVMAELLCFSVDDIIVFS